MRVDVFEKKRARARLCVNERQRDCGRKNAYVRKVHSTSHHITGCEAHSFGTLWRAGARWRRHYVVWATSQCSRLSTAQDVQQNAVQLSKPNRKCVFNRSDRSKNHEQD